MYIHYKTEFLFLSIHLTDYWGKFIQAQYNRIYMAAPFAIRDKGRF